MRFLIYEHVYHGPKTLFFLRKKAVSFYVDSLELTSYPFANHSGLALLRTFRQAYMEGLDIAFRSNIFNLQGRAKFENVHCYYLRTQRVYLIRHLDVQWVYSASPDSTDRTWGQIWNGIAIEMKLLSLELHFEFSGLRDQVNLGASWLMPLRQVRGIKNVIVDIHWVDSRGTTLCTLNDQLRSIMSLEDQFSTPPVERSKSCTNKLSPV